eukprot:Tamp_09323.p1 GENE.Tamp_09323~~Tamp_09323.p1  ORF type:complete len:659 (+),score=106.53 Tamp_09323:107-1978(+)
MSGARLRAAKEGAISILETLQDGDMLCIFTFNGGVQQLIPTIEINPASKLALALKIASIEADGRTALYDAILATSQEILKASMGAKLLQHLLDDTKTRRFLLVVLTDGADVCSKHTLQDTCGMLAKLQQAKELGLLKILFIGVQLEASAEAAMKRLTSAAGDCASYENVTSVEAIKAKFHEIELSLRVGTSSSTPQTSTTIDWDGLIGRHVRIVGHSKGLGGMYIGAIGVVQSQRSDGAYKVNFIEEDDWIASEEDLVVDDDADDVRPGQRVRVKPQKSLDDLKFGKGPLEPGMVGLVTSVSHDGKVEVDYGFRPKRELTFLLSELEPVFTGEGHWKNCPIQVGLPVRVKKGISEPSCQWGNLKQGDVGFARFLGTNDVIQSNFPRTDNWNCKVHELEIDPTALLIKPGEKVRVKKSVTTPEKGWAGITHESVGIVSFVNHDGVVKVDFPSRSTPWQAHMYELEPIPADQLSTIELKRRARHQGHKPSDISACRNDKSKIKALVKQGPKLSSYCKASSHPSLVPQKVSSAKTSEPQVMPSAPPMPAFNPMHVEPAVVVPAGVSPPAAGGDQDKENERLRLLLQLKTIEAQERERDREERKPNPAPTNQAASPPTRQHCACVVQ